MKRGWICAIAIGVTSTATQAQQVPGPSFKDVIGLKSVGQPAISPDGKAVAYTLRTVDGNPVPATFSDPDGDELRFNSGSLTLNQGGTYNGALGVTFNSAPFDLADEGTFTRSGNTLTFASTIDADNDFTATISGTTITAATYEVAGAPFALVLRK